MSDKESRCYGRYAENERHYAKIEQLRAELAQAQVDKELAQQSNTVCMQEAVVLHAHLADACAARDMSIREAEMRTAQLTQARAELAAVDESLGEFYCPVLDPETDELCGSFWKDHGVNVMSEALECAETKLAQARIELKQVKKLWLNRAGATQLRNELAQARQELAAIDEALGEYCRPGCEDHGVYQVRRRLDYIGEIASKRSVKLTQALNERNEAEAELALARQAAQEQSEEVQHNCLSPVEAEGLRRQLEIARSNRDSWFKAHGDALVLVKIAEIERDEAQQQLNDLRTDATCAALADARRVAGLWFGTAQKQAWRLATLDAAEKALADCGSRGIYTDFDGPADAIMQMAARIERFEDESMIEVEITGQEMVEALQAERQERVEAERCHRAALALAQSRGELLAHAKLQVHLTGQRAETLAAERVDIHEALDECQIPRLYDDAKPASAKTRIFWLNQRTTRAEALAGLVTFKAAKTIDQLASNTQALANETKEIASIVALWREDARAGRELAKQIREALDDSKT